MRKKIIILFNGVHLSYSPTVIGLYDLLSKHFDVNIIAESPAGFDNKPLPNRNVIYKKELGGKNHQRIINKLFYLLSLFKKEIALLKEKKANLKTFYELLIIRKYLKKEKPNFVIAVDFKNLWYTQILNIKVEFVSLEILSEDIYYRYCNFQNIDSVIIQTKERYNYLFKEKNFKTFFIQNAPVFTPYISNQVRRGLVYCGTAWDPFGFYHCLKFLNDFSDYTMNVKGAILKEDKVKIETDYSNLILNRQLIIDDKYFDDSEIIDYLRQFRIGFCFYNFELDWINNFNYLSAPSGKMFKYFAAGVPVIGQDILGLNPVREFDCGVLIKDLKPESIKKAIDTIENNFEYYSENCLKAAEHYSLDKTAQPFIDYLLKNN